MKPLFFLGSGADSDFCDQLKSGQSFASALLLSRYKAESEMLNGDEFKSYRFIYPSSTKVYLQTISTHPDEARKVIDESVVEKCLSYVKKNNEVTYKEIRDYSSIWYKCITDDTKPNEIREFFLKYAVLFDSLDEKFNSLRLIELNDSAKRIIDAYTQVFVLMLKSVYNLDANFSWNYVDVFRKLNEPYDIYKSSNKSTYYSAIKSSKLKSKIVTTNYTSLAEETTERSTIYLHGKLTWFEDLTRLTVFDCTDNREQQSLIEADRILPFILIPSGVKPLICPKQIREFSKFIEELEGTDTLVVVGYKFNSEDNHVNSIIADWLRNANKTMIYLNYNNDISFDDLRWASDFPVESFKGFDSVSISQASETKIINISTDSHSCNKDFSAIISYLEDNA